MPRVAKTVQVDGIQHAHGTGTVLGHAPAELFFGGKAVEEDNSWINRFQQLIESGIIDLNSVFCNALVQWGCKFTLCRCRGKGKLPALLQKKPYHLHRTATRRRRDGLGPYLAYDQ